VTSEWNHSVPSPPVPKPEVYTTSFVHTFRDETLEHCRCHYFLRAYIQGRNTRTHSRPLLYPYPVREKLAQLGGCPALRLDTCTVGPANYLSRSVFGLSPSPPWSISLSLTQFFCSSESIGSAGCVQRSTRPHATSQQARCMWCCAWLDSLPPAYN
jgi:hypothetical protein